MVQTVVSRRFRFFALALTLLVPSAALAHRLDEYLQATLVTVEPGAIRLQINLTPGVAVAQKVLAHIDLNRDGVISTNEAATYAQSLGRDLTLRLDGEEAAGWKSAAGSPTTMKAFTEKRRTEE